MDVPCVGTDAAFPSRNDAVTASATFARQRERAAAIPARGRAVEDHREQARRPLECRLVDHALEHVVSRLAAPTDGAFVARALGHAPQAAYNPLVIVGPAGAGKSRLVGDLFIRYGRARHESDPQAHIGGERPSAAGTVPTVKTPCLWDGRSLGRDLTAALSSDTLHRLHARFEAAGLVVVDGIEQIPAWDAQRWLALLFDVATAAGTAVVVTLRMHPSAAPGLEPSLASRLSGGLVVSLPPPAAIRRCGGGDGAAAPPSLRRIIGLSARRHGLAVADITGPSRRRSVTEARGEAMYIARTLTGKSLEALGSGFGGRDHTTVLHGIRVTERRRARNPVLAAEIDRTIDALRRPARRRRGTPRPRS